MIDLATFRTFPRASPNRQSEALVAERDEPVEKGAPTDEALATQFTQELRAQRRAARTNMRDSERWAEPAIVPPPVSPIPAAVDRSPAPAEPIEVPLPEAELIKPAPVPVDHADPSHESPRIHAEPAAAERSAPPEADEGRVPEPASQPQHDIAHDEPAARDAIAVDPDPEPLIPHAEPASPASPASPPHALAPDTTPDAEITERSPTPRESVLADDPWPIEPPTILAGEEMLPVAPPKPLEPETAPPIEAVSEPDARQLLPTEDEAQALILQDDYRSGSLTLDYRLLGLANPLVCTVTGKLGDTAPVELTIGRTGIYRPDGFRPAPWSGFAYDVSPDGRTGFVLGTRVLTARGEVPVEDLVPGDTALALRGPALLPIVWIGRSLAASPPVEIAANAFGLGRPGKTLRVGADHPIFMQSMPVLARDLVNGDTIRTIETETAELFHVDVGIAEVLLAEGIPLSSGCR